MTTNYTWHIERLERELSDGYVYKAHYRVTADDGTYTVNYHDEAFLEKPESDLISYEELTPEIVTEWVTTYLGPSRIEKLQNKLQGLLDECHTPVRAVGLPWYEPPTEPVDDEPEQPPSLPTQADLEKE